MYIVAGSNWMRGGVQVIARSYRYKAKRQGLEDVHIDKAWAHSRES